MPSRLTFLIVLVLLAALHALIGWRVVSALPWAFAWQVLADLWLLASLILIPAALIGPRAGLLQPGRATDVLEWVGMLAMGWFSSLIVLTLVREIALPLLRLADIDAASVSAELVVGLATLGTVVGFFNARRLAGVVRVDVPIKGLPAGLENFTIAQITDIHVGPTIKRNYLQAIVDRTNGLNADLIAVTGDLVDGSVRQLQDQTAPLAELQARHGVYFVTGNHEYYSNADQWVAEVRRLGITVLMNEHVLLQHNGAALLVAGVTDYSAHAFDERQRSDPHRAMAGAPARPGALGARILLAHQPRSAPAAADAGFDLQLSGHTHGGQFFPWNFFVPLQQPYVAGMHRLRDLWIYTSRGTGYWGPPKRLFAPSEITVLRLRPA